MFFHHPDPCFNINSRVPKADFGYVVEREKTHLPMSPSSLRSTRTVLKSSRLACSLHGLFDTIMELCIHIHYERSMNLEEVTFLWWQFSNAYPITTFTSCFHLSSTDESPKITPHSSCHLSSYVLVEGIFIERNAQIEATIERTTSHWWITRWSISTAMHWMNIVQNEP